MRYMRFCLHRTVLLGAAAFASLGACTALDDRVLFEDDFRGGLSNWVVEQMPGGSVRTVGASLEIEDAEGCTVWFRHRLEAPVLIEYFATMQSAGRPFDRVSDLNCFWMAIDPRHPDDLFANSEARGGRFANYHDLRLYYCGYGGNANTTTRFRRYPGGGERPLSPEHDLSGAEYQNQAMRRVRVRIRCENGRTSYEHDGRVLFSLDDPEPFTSGWFGFRTVKNRVRFEDFRVLRP